MKTSGNTSAVELRSLYKRLLLSCAYITDPVARQFIKEAFAEAAGISNNLDAKASFDFTFSVSTACILADDLGLDSNCIAAALLQQSDLTTSENQASLLKKFGSEIVHILTRLQQIEKIRTDKISLDPDNFIHLLLSFSDDVRVMLIRLAGRIYYLRNISQLPSDEQKSITVEIASLYSPLAHRLGLYKVKSELDDLAMRQLMPDVYHSIAKKIKETAAEQKKYFETFIQPIRKSLLLAGLDFEIKARTKSVPSIYLKMKNQGIDFDEVYDFFAIRVILNSTGDNEKPDCWKAYSHITDIYPPNTSRLRDWISVPRPNGYESLHVTVDAPGNNWVEVQIRTRRMDDAAEKGMAAHWRYKEQKGAKAETSDWWKKIRGILENYTPGEDELSRSADMKIHSEYIYVFTPGGDIKKLRAGATILDFAFEIHTEVGQHCTGAKVNNLFVPLKYVLKTGDKIEVITSKNQKPNRDWLNWATTSRALLKIKRFLKDLEFSQAETGKDLLMRKLGQLKVDYSDEVGNKLVLFYKAESALDLFHGLAEGKYEIQKIKEAIQPSPKPEEIKVAAKTAVKIPESQRKSAKQKTLIIINEDTPLSDVKFARCCQPVYGDEIFGFVTVAEGIKIHRRTCSNAHQLFERFQYRIVAARWADTTEITSYVATIRVSGTDQTGILNEITLAVTGDMRANIRSINLNSHNGRFDGNLLVNVEGKSHLNLIISRLMKVKGIRKVTRET